MCKHQNESKKYINKPQIHLWKTHKDASYYVPQAFSFDTRSSLYFAYDGDFHSDLARFYKLYQEDKIFQQYLQDDCKSFNKEVTENQILFFLEEHLMMYLISKHKISLKNDHAPHHDRTLICYPWKPPKHQVYIMQQNFLKLSDDNNFYGQSRYDLTDKKLYDFSKIDLDTYML
jgi:hypothetical protein